MLKNSYIKISVFILSLFLALSFIYVRSGMFSLMGYEASVPDLIHAAGKIKSPSTGQKSVDEQESPDYFRIFRFINNFAPGKK